MKPGRLLDFKRSPARATDFERAFLPAALEIVETPPAPGKRILGAVIILLFSGTIAWTVLGSVDIVATASGKVIPSGRSKIIQPFETGVVRAIHVRDGQKVKAGDVLVELDSTITGAELEHLKSDLLTTQLFAARLRAALSDADDPAQRFNPPSAASPTQIALHLGFLKSQVLEFRSKIAEIERQRLQKAAEIETVDAGISKIETTLPVLKDRLDTRKTLYDSALGSKITYLADLQDYLSQQSDLKVQKSKMREAEAAVGVLEQTKLRTEAEYRHKLFADLADAEQKIAGLSQDVIKAEQRAKLQVLTAPVDGTVQQLAVHTVGGVVTPAQALAVVVPSESRLEIEAMLSNRDIGFVTEGQDARIKVDTFSFTRYGLLHGRVLSVSGDAITRNKSEGATADESKQSDIASSEPRGQELVYAARVSMDKERMQIDDRSVELSPGMAVTVEIKTGTRRIISYLLSPLLRYGHDALRER